MMLRKYIPKLLRQSNSHRVLIGACRVIPLQQRCFFQSKCTRAFAHSSSAPVLLKSVLPETTKPSIETIQNSGIMKELAQFQSEQANPVQAKQFLVNDKKNKER